MERHIYRKVLGMVFLTGLVLISSCDKQMTGEPGILEGTISIGPICPVETIPPSQDCLPSAETYKAYPVSVWTSEGHRKVIQLSPALNGAFKAELLPGSYLVILETGHNGIGSSNLPVIINIKSLDSTILNIDIDTGIR